MNGLKSGKDRTRNPEPVLFVFALERTADTDSHRELSRLPSSLDDALARSGRVLFANRSLLFANLMTLVAANSDLTEPPGKESSLKEVIQPHLPVRLPCYDFTPLTGHSFGTSVPYGFGQRLREHQTRVM